MNNNFDAACSNGIMITLCPLSPILICGLGTVKNAEPLTGYGRAPRLAVCERNEKHAQKRQWSNAQGAHHQKTLQQQYSIVAFNVNMPNWRSIYVAKYKPVA